MLTASQDEKSDNLLIVSASFILNLEESDLNAFSERELFRINNEYLDGPELNAFSTSPNTACIIIYALYLQHILLIQFLVC